MYSSACAFTSDDEDDDEDDDDDDDDAQLALGTCTCIISFRGNPNSLRRSNTKYAMYMQRHDFIKLS